MLKSLHSRLATIVVPRHAYRNLWCKLPLFPELRVASHVIFRNELAPIPSCQLRVKALTSATLAESPRQLGRYFFDSTDPSRPHCKGEHHT